MIETVGIRFKEGGKIYDFDADGMKFNKDDYAMVETVRGIECGKVAKGNHGVSEDNITQPLKKVIRVATENDIKTLKQMVTDINEEKVGIEEQLTDNVYVYRYDKQCLEVA